MLILGIESSCDETAAAIVENGRYILSNIIASQISLHRKTGGVVPEVAAREHVVKIVPVIKRALAVARCELKDIDAFAVTAGPGLLSSVLVGVNAAMTLALVQHKPLIPVNHVEGHIYANWLLGGRGEGEAEGKADGVAEPKFPAAVLTVSGGHNELLIWRGHGDYKFLGATMDDAAGEAFDKVARLLGLSYPGGPSIQKAALGGNPESYKLPRPWVTPWDFSFSGLKTAMLLLVKKHGGAHGAKKLSARFVADAAASFEECVCEVLATKLVNAAKKYRVTEVHLAGGVSANQRLRKWVEKLLTAGPAWPASAGPNSPQLRFCKDLILCTDNAAMIASAGYYKFHKAHKQGRAALYKKWKPIIADPNLEIRNW